MSEFKLKKTRIYHTGNSALLFDDGSNRVMIDGIYGSSTEFKGKKYDVGMSEMPSEALEMLRLGTGIYSEISIMLFTHNHGDHYREDLIDQYLKQHNKVQYYAPDDRRNTIFPQCCGEGIYVIENPEFKIYVIPTEHLPFGKGFEELQETIHCSYLLDFGCEKYFVAGDGMLNKGICEKVRELSGGSLTGIFVNVIQVFSIQCKGAIKLLNPDTVVLYHLPDAKDDKMNYLAMSKQAEKKAAKECSRFIIADHMKWL